MVEVYKIPKETPAEVKKAEEMELPEEKEITRMRDETIKALEEMGKKGFLTKKCVPAAMKGLQTADDGMLIEGNINGANVKFSIDHDAIIKSMRLSMDGHPLSSEDAKRFQEKYERIAFDLDKEEKLCEQISAKRHRAAFEYHSKRAEEILF